MSDIFIDVAAAEAAMRSVAAATGERAAAHAAAPPEYPTSAAGRGFAGSAARLQAAFARVHERGQERLAAVEATAHAAVEQFAVVDAADAARSGALRQVGEAL